MRDSFSETSTDSVPMRIGRPLFVHFSHLFQDRIIFFALGHVNFIIGIVAVAGTVGGDLEHFESCRSL